MCRVATPLRTTRACKEASVGGLRRVAKAVRVGKNRAGAPPPRFDVQTVLPALQLRQSGFLPRHVAVHVLSLQVILSHAR